MSENEVETTETAEVKPVKPKKKHTALKVLAAIAAIVIVAVGIAALAFFQNINSYSTSSDGNTGSEIGTAYKTEDNQSSNYLMNLEVKTGEALSADGKTSIGTYAYIVVNKNEFDQLSGSVVKSFLEQRVENAGYAWFTIDFGNTTGIYMPNCDTTDGIYCEIGADKAQTTNGTVYGHYRRNAGEAWTLSTN